MFVFISFDDLIFTLDVEKEDCFLLIVNLDRNLLAHELEFYAIRGMAFSLITL